MASEKRLKYIIQKYPEFMLPLTSNNQRQFERVVRRSLERSYRSQSRKKLTKPTRKLSRLIIEDCLTCAVCKNILNVPVTLECGDTFCRGCLLEQVARNNNNNNNNNNCPECGWSFHVEGIKCNVLVQDIVSRITTGRVQDPKLIDNRLDDDVEIPHNYELRSRIQNSNKTFPCSVKRKREPDASDHLELEQQTIGPRNNIYAVTAANNEVCRPLLTSSDVDCILCSRCLFEPVTTICGHTFCRPCLARVLDYGLSCPLCMAQLSNTANTNGNGGETGTVCKTLEKIIKRLLPQEYKERVDGYKEEIMAVDEDEQIPVFICTSAFPGVACPLYVYEPRYRLLTRRCLQTNKRRFAMAAAVGPSSSTSSNNNNNNNNNASSINGNTGNGENLDGSINENGRFAQYGTVLEVHDAVHLQDGTSILTTVGLRRFKVLSRGEKDGYDTARIEYIHDTPIPLNHLPYLRVLHERVHRKAVRWVHSLAPQIHAEIEQSLGAMPPLEANWCDLPDGPSWAWWLMPVLPLSAHLQLGFLSTCSLEKRLRAIDKLLDRMSVRMRARERGAAAGVMVQTEEETNDSCAHATERERERERDISNHAHTMEF